VIGRLNRVRPRQRVCYIQGAPDAGLRVEVMLVEPVQEKRHCSARPRVIVKVPGILQQRAYVHDLVARPGNPGAEIPGFQPRLKGTKPRESLHQRESPARHAAQRRQGHDHVTREMGATAPERVVGVPALAEDHRIAKETVRILEAVNGPRAPSPEARVLPVGPPKQAHCQHRVASTVEGGLCSRVGVPVTALVNTAASHEVQHFAPQVVPRVRRLCPLVHGHLPVNHCALMTNRPGSMFQPSTATSISPAGTLGRLAVISRLSPGRSEK